MSTAPHPPVELRVLSGLHAGARAPLEGDTHLLGAQEDCDFVLGDDGVLPHHARLSRREAGWQLDWIAADGEAPALAPVLLQPGKAVLLGPVVICVDDAQAAWPTLEQLVVAPHAPAPEAALPAPSTAPPLPVAVPSWRRFVRGMLARGAVALGTAAAMLALSALAFVAAPPGARSDEMLLRAAAMPASAPAPAPDAASRVAIDEALGRLGLAGRSRVEAAGADWLVRAGVKDDAEAETVTTALARLQPRPQVRLSTEQDLRDALSDLVLRTMPEQRVAIELHFGEDGRVQLEGRMPDAAQREPLLHALAQAFPHLRWDPDALLTPQEQAGRFEAQLRAHGWPLITRWNRDLLEIDVALTQRDVPEWERVLAEAARGHAPRFAARVAFVQAAPAATAAAPAAAHEAGESRLPFTILSVVGGDMPYVLLSGGERLAQGGSSQGWRFAGLTGHEVVFENGAQRATVAR